MRGLIIASNDCRESEAFAAAMDCLRAHDVDVVRPDTTGAGDPAEAIARYRQQVDCILVAGGDGSLNASLAGVLESGLPLGVLPLGTANDFARNLALPTDLDEACAVIAAGKIHLIDVGLLGNDHFLNVAHLGLGTRVTRELTSALKQRWGALAYARAFGSAFRKRRRFGVRLECDGEVHSMNAIEVAIANGRYFGGGMPIDDHAFANDGKLTVYAVEPVRAREVAVMAFAFWRGRQRRLPTIRALHCTRVRLDAEPALDVSVDGEIMSRTPADFSVLPRALPVYVPKTVNNISDGLVHDS